MSLAPMYLVAVSAFIDVAANMMLQKSKRFRRIGWGLGAIFLVWFAFWLLGEAVVVMDLAVAYALWGGIGVFGTAILGKPVFQQHLRPVGWLGIALIICAVFVLNWPEAARAS